MQDTQHQEKSKQQASPADFSYIHIDNRYCLYYSGNTQTTVHTASIKDPKENLMKEVAKGMVFETANNKRYCFKQVEPNSQGEPQYQLYTLDQDRLLRRKSHNFNKAGVICWLNNNISDNFLEQLKLYFNQNCNPDNNVNVLNKILMNNDSKHHTAHAEIVNNEPEMNEDSTCNNAKTEVNYLKSLLINPKILIKYKRNNITQEENLKLIETQKIRICGNFFEESNNKTDQASKLNQILTLKTTTDFTKNTSDLNGKINSMTIGIPSNTNLFDKIKKIFKKNNVDYFVSFDNDILRIFIIEKINEMYPKEKIDYSIDVGKMLIEMYSKYSEKIDDNTDTHKINEILNDKNLKILDFLIELNNSHEDYINNKSKKNEKWGTLSYIDELKEIRNKIKPGMFKRIMFFLGRNSPEVKYYYQLGDLIKRYIEAPYRKSKLQKISAIELKRKQKLEPNKEDIYSLSKLANAQKKAKDSKGFKQTYKIIQGKLEHNTELQKTLKHTTELKEIRETNHCRLLQEITEKGESQASTFSLAATIKRFFGSPNKTSILSNESLTDLNSNKQFTR